MTNPTADQPLLRRLHEIAGALVTMPGVRAVALGGSLGRAILGRGVDPDGAPPHDADLYVYAEPLPEAALRSATIETLGARDPEIDRHFWETEDSWIDSETGHLIEVMYRDPAWIEGELDRLLIRNDASVGYTTCLWDNVRDSISLADPTGWNAKLHAHAQSPYPIELRAAIIAKNHPILRTIRAGYRDQIAAAVVREDLVSVNHRVGAALASFFDILFAANLATHPGEKRLLAFSEARCPARPQRLRAQVDALLNATDTDVVPALDALLDDLDTLLRSLALIP